MQRSNPTETTTSDTPSLYDLLRLFLEEEFRNIVCLGPGGSGGYEGRYFLCINKPGKTASGLPTITKQIIGWVDGNNVTLKISNLDKYFNYSKSYDDTRNVADPNFFNWLTHSIENEYYSELRQIGFLNEDGTRNTKT